MASFSGEDQETIEHNIDRLCDLMLQNSPLFGSSTDIPTVPNQQTYGDTHISAASTTTTTTTEGFWSSRSEASPCPILGLDLFLTKPFTTMSSTRSAPSPVFSVPRSPPNVTFATGLPPLTPVFQHDIRLPASSQCALPYRRPVRTPIPTPMLRSDWVPVSNVSSSQEGDLKIDYVPDVAQQRSSRSQGYKKGSICNYCRNNKEMKSLYMSHRTHVNGIVTCPVLRRYICPNCGATGDNAHTVSYCPVKPRASMAALTRTPRKSCGCQRNK